MSAQTAPNVNQPALVALDRLEAAERALDIVATMPGKASEAIIALRACTRIAVSAGRLALRPTAIAEDLRDAAADRYHDPAIREVMEQIGSAFAKACDRGSFTPLDGMAAGAGVACATALIAFDLAREAAHDGGTPPAAFIEAYLSLIRTGLDKLIYKTALEPVPRH